MPSLSLSLSCIFTFIMTCCLLCKANIYVYRNWVLYTVFNKLIKKIILYIVRISQKNDKRVTRTS